MQGEQLLQDPEFAKTLEQSPFQAQDLPNITGAVADSFERMTPEMRQELRKAIDELDDLSEEELMSFLRMIAYVEQNPDQYPELVKQLVASGAFEAGDVPEQYDPNLMGVVKALIGQALMKVRAPSQPMGFAKGGIATLKKQAENVSSAGRKGDSMLAHITPFEATMLKRMGGSGTINPKTGLPEYFLKSLGNIFKIGAQVVATAALSWFVGPIAAGAIVGGATSLLSGGKPADALKSALIGGALGGLSGGISSSLSGGSFMEGAFAGGSVFGSKPYETFLSRALSGTSVGDALFKTPGGAAEAAAAGTTEGMMANPPIPAPRPIEAGGSAINQAITTGALKPTVEAAAPSAFSSEGIKSLWSNYKLPILLGGGAALIGLSQSQKENIKPSMIKGPTGSELLAQQPGTYGFNAANFSQVTPASPTPVFPGGGYIAPTTTPSYAPPAFDFGRIRYPTTGIMNAKVGGHISGPGDGTSDSIPARLSDGEFVMTAKAVRGAGKGSRMKGARKMYELMHKFERMA
jgi:hypothetical protein